MSHFFAMSIFALTMSISPGPVNIITLSSGANNGFIRTLPFVSGATIGFTFLLLILGLGAVELIKSFPYFMKIMGYAGAIFLLYMAFKIFRAKGQMDQQKNKVPSFMEGALLQWLNPKAWIACISGVAAFTTIGNLGSLLLFCGIYLCLCYFGVGFWAVVGAQARQFTHADAHMRIFNKIMGSGLAAVAIYLLFNQ